jgi:hypothetical protein
MSNFVDVKQADVPLSPLNAADVGAVEPTSKRKRLLRKSLHFAKLTHPITEVRLDLLVSLAHLFLNGIIMTTMSPRTLRTVD